MKAAKWTAISSMVMMCLMTTAFAQRQPTTAPVASTATTKEAVQEAQQRLQALGYKFGSVDGVMGSGTIAALKKFQSDRGLPATGMLDQKTVDALGAKAVSRPVAVRASSPTSPGQIKQGKPIAAKKESGNESQFPDVVDGELKLASFMTVNGPSSPSLWIVSHEPQKKGWNCEGGEQVSCFVVALTEKTTLPPGWDLGGLQIAVALGFLPTSGPGGSTEIGLGPDRAVANLAEVPGTYAVRGKISGNRIAAGGIKALSGNITITRPK